MGGFLFRLFTRCCDCNERYCPVWLFADEEREHKGWCGK